MDQVVLLCVDGSEDSLAAASTGLRRLAPGRVVLATVVDAGDPTLLSGVGGVAGGTMTPEQFEEMGEVRRRAGAKVLSEAAAALDLPDAEQQVLAGGPGIELCLLSEEIGATVVVVGSRGRGRVKRALLGSVSDHVARHAPCPVLVVRDAVEDQPVD